MFTTKEAMDRHALKACSNQDEREYSNTEILPFLMITWDLTSGQYLAPGQHKTIGGLGWSKKIYVLPHMRSFAENKNGEKSYATFLSKRKPIKKSVQQLKDEKKRQIMPKKIFGLGWNKSPEINVEFDPLTLWLNLLNIPGCKKTSSEPATERLLDQTGLSPQEVLRELVLAAE